MARWMLAAAVTALTLAAPAAASPATNPLCEDGRYATMHPLICDTGGGGPFSITPGGGGGGGSGGLLGTIGRVLGGLTGGIL